MNRQELEAQLRDEALQLQANCPPHVRHRVAARLRRSGRQPARRPFGRPVLAGAFAIVALLVSTWMLWRPATVEDAAPSTAGLNAAPIVANSDRLLASREAALENEWQLLERDLRNLRDHVTATFDRKPNG